MHASGRIIAWLLPALLLCGGCAAPALNGPTAAIDAVEQEAASESSATETSAVSPIVLAEAALIRETARERGYSPAEAQRFEESILNAQPHDRQFLTRFIYAQLNRGQTESSISPVTAAPSDSEPAHPVSRTLSSQGVASATTPPPAGRSDSKLDEKANSASQSAAAQADAQSTATESSPQELSAATKSRSRDTDENAPTATSDLDQPATAAAGAATQVRPASATDEDDTVVQQASLATTIGNRPVATSQEKDPAQLQSDAEEEARLSWQRELRQAIVRLRNELTDNDNLDPVDESRLRTCLGLMQLAAEDPEKAMEALEGLDEEQLEFWRQTILGLDILMDADELPKMRYRVESASEHLQNGLSTLATLGPLRVDNMAFVREVRSFGVYEELSTHGFEPGEQVILYVEVGNFTVAEMEVDQRDLTISKRRSGLADQVPIYETELQGRYDILDAGQKIVASRNLPAIRDRCRRRRHDFFIPYEFYMPKDIPAGHYTLELTIEDKKGNKFGSGTIDFRVR